MSESWTPEHGTPAPRSTPFTALWDTGAVQSVITQRVVDACRLTPFDTMTIYGISGPERTDVYSVNVALPNGIAFPRLRVVKGSFIMGADVLIGMDIINQGDFAITHPGGKTKFTFRVPSQADIDFVEEDEVA